MDYADLLNHGYSQTKEDYDLTKLEFLSKYIFGFTTYEGEISSMMGLKALEVCFAISNSKTFEYIKVESDHVWYLIMVNMPFFKDRINWGTSIRGAWWDEHQTINSCGLFNSEGEQVLELEFERDEWCEFISVMVDFVK